MIWLYLEKRPENALMVHDRVSSAEADLVLEAAEIDFETKIILL